MHTNSFSTHTHITQALFLPPFSFNSLIVRIIRLDRYVLHNVLFSILFYSWVGQRVRDGDGGRGTVKKSKVVAQKCFRCWFCQAAAVAKRKSKQRGSCVYDQNTFSYIHLKFKRNKIEEAAAAAAKDSIRVTERTEENMNESNVMSTNSRFYRDLVAVSV